MNTVELHLKSAGYSLTKPRQIVFDTLRDKGPLSMQELYTLLSPVNRTTVYRIVELFEELNIAQRVAKGWKYKLELTDQFIPHHHHFTCTKCHASISFDEPAELDSMLNALANNNGFKLERHTLEIEGICLECSS